MSVAWNVAWITGHWYILQPSTYSCPGIQRVCSPWKYRQQDVWSDVVCVRVVKTFVSFWDFSVFIFTSYKHSLAKSLSVLGVIEVWRQIEDTAMIHCSSFWRQIPLYRIATVSYILETPWKVVHGCFRTSPYILGDWMSYGAKFHVYLTISEALTSRNDIPSGW